MAGVSTVRMLVKPLFSICCQLLWQLQLHLLDYGLLPLLGTLAFKKRLLGSLDGTVC